MSVRSSGVPIDPVGEHGLVMWQPGQTVVHQEIWNNRIWAARPLTVVEDTDQRTLLWLPHGTIRKVPITPPERPDPVTISDRTIANLHHSDWALGEHEWDVSSLWILRPRDWYSIWVSWQANGDHLGWYLNVQRPMRRNPIGFEAMDLMLDVIVEPDLSWRWKDLDEFEEILQLQIFDYELGSRARRSALGVIADIEAHHPPFAEPWPSWRPDPQWPIPTLPDGWDQIHP